VGRTPLTPEDDPVKGSKHVVITNYAVHNSVYFVLLMLQVVVLTDLNIPQTIYMYYKYLYSVCAYRRDVYMHTVSKGLETNTEYVSVLFFTVFFLHYDEQFSEDLTLL
jgi:hypothetical protein